MQNFDEVKRDFIEWCIWIHYDKNKMNHAQYKDLIEAMANAEDLEYALKETIITHSDYYLENGCELTNL